MFDQGTQQSKDFLMWFAQTASLINHIMASNKDQFRPRPGDRDVEPLRLE
jgi:hypothetical protein